MIGLSPRSTIRIATPRRPTICFETLTPWLCQPRTPRRRPRSSSSPAATTPCAESSSVPTAHLTPTGSPECWPSCHRPTSLRSPSWQSTIVGSMSIPRPAAPASDSKPPVRPVNVLVHSGEPTTMIHRHLADASPDLVAVGTRGLTGLRRLRLGLTASAMARAATCSVLVAVSRTNTPARSRPTEKSPGATQRGVRTRVWQPDRAKPEAGRSVQPRPSAHVYWSVCSCVLPTTPIRACARSLHGSASANSRVRHH